MNKDYWYDLAKADGVLDPEEKPQLNAEGFLYYVRFGEDGESPFPISQGFKSFKDAVRWAENKAPSPISWNEPE